jgi:hypothetical protein
MESHRRLSKTYGNMDRVKNEPDLAEKIETLKKELEVTVFQA